MKTNLRSLCFCFVALLLLFVAQSKSYSQKFYPTNTVDEEILAQKIDDYANQVIKQWQLPGFALAVSVDNKIIFSKGYGYKEVRAADGVGFKGVKPTDRSQNLAGIKSVVNAPNSPIGTKTLFHIASISKSFTATVMAQLVEEGLVRWTDTVKNILPDFAIFSSEGDYVTNNMLVRDVFLHSTGLIDEAGTYFSNLGYDRYEIYKMLPYLKPGFSFRSAYDYNNTTFVIALKIIEKLTNKSCETNISERVLKPLKMNNTQTNALGFVSQKDVATPHDWSYNGKIEVLPLYNDEQALNWLNEISAAGGLSSNAEEMIRYAQFHCNNGYIVNRDTKGNVVDTTFIMPYRAMHSLHRGYTLTSQDSTRTTLYAPCWFVEQNNRYRLYFHTGTSWGMTAICFFVPEIKLSGVMLVNCEANANPRYAMMRRIIDLVRGEAALKDYSTEFYNSYIAARDKAIAESNAKPKSEILPELDKSIYVGRYKKEGDSAKQELFGDIVISLERGDLYFSLKGRFKRILNHISGSKYFFRVDGHGFGVDFNVENGKVTSLMMEFGEREESAFGGWIKS